MNLPGWSEGEPPKPGVYVAFSTNPQRRAERATFCIWDGTYWRHWTGFYDHAITHWMETDMPAPAKP